MGVDVRQEAFRVQALACGAGEASLCHREHTVAKQQPEGCTLNASYRRSIHSAGSLFHLVQATQTITRPRSFSWAGLSAPCRLQLSVRRNSYLPHDDR